MDIYLNKLGKMMSSITALKDKIDTKTLNLFLLSVATAGIYPILWMYRNCSIIESITKKHIASDIYIIWIAVCAGLSKSFSGSSNELLIGLFFILSIAGGVLYIVWAFKAKSALQEYALNEHKIDLRMNAFYTFFFNIYYINYCINDLPEVKRKQDILNSNNSDNTENSSTVNQEK